MKKDKKKVAVEPKSLLKNSSYRNYNSGKCPKYCYCPDCRCQQCNN